MMGLSDGWRRDTLWEYQAVLDGWNKRHAQDGDKPPVTAADKAHIKVRLEALRSPENARFLH